MLIIWEKFYGLSNIGHYHTQIKAIHNLVPEAKLIILCTKNAKNIDTFLSKEQVISCLYEKKIIAKRPLFYSKKIQESIDELFQICKNKRKEILVPSADYYDFITVIEIANDASSSIIFHVRVLNIKDIQKLSYKYIESLRRHIIQGKIILLSETDNLKRYLWGKFEIKAEHSFHLPCAILPDHIPKIKDDKKQKVKILFAGGLRGEKGYYRLPEIFRVFSQISTTYKEHISVEFLLEKNDKISKGILKRILAFKSVYTEIMIANLKKKAITKNISFKRFQPSFDDNDYIKLIDDADILLLPYKFKLYQNRGSGVIADGVLAGKIFIYTQGVGMESFLKFGNGLPANSSANFAINIMKIILNLESFNQKTLVARDEYIRSLNETKLYLKRLL